MSAGGSTDVSAEQAIVLFDGVCNFCDRTVQFILARDRRRHFKFAPLQSGAGVSLLQQHGLPTDDLYSVVLLEGEHAYTRSTAALRILKHLGGLWSILYLFIVIPRPIRDLFYRFFAQRRYRWFGQMDQCMVPPPEVKDRFLNGGSNL